jgi:Mn-containing catalase
MFKHVKTAVEGSPRRPSDPNYAAMMQEQLGGPQES